MTPPGPAHPPAPPSPANDARLTPMMRQYRSAKTAHPDAILFFRMGDFYEMFDEDAILASRLLGITLTSRDRKSGHPMAGVPWHSAEGYIARLVRLGYRVAICEQVEDPKLAKGLVDRKVTELITPGTAISQGLVLENDNSYLAALAPAGDGRWGVALVDASTGELAAGEFDVDALVPELARRPVVEILGPEGVTLPDGVRRGADPEAPPIMVTVRAPWCFDAALGRQRLRQHFGTVSLDPFDADDLEAGLGAAAALLDYLAEMRGSEPRHVTSLQRLRSRSAMTLDPATLLHLDILPRRGEASDGTLLGVLDATRTPMGARLLRGWLCRPSMDLEEIEARQRAVGALAGDDGRRGGLRATLGRLGDLERLAGRIEAGKGGARELRAVAEALAQVPTLVDGIGNEVPARLAALRDALDPVTEIRERIFREIVDAPPLSSAEGGIFRDGVDDELDEARTASRSGKTWIAELEAEERRRTGISKLKIGFNKVFGYYIEVTRSQIGGIPDDYIRKQTLVNAERYITPGLKEMESKVLGAEERIARIEQRLLVELRDDVSAEIGRILGTARAVRELDVLAGLAETARARSYVCPQVTEGGCLEIIGGRHPVVEEMLRDDGFVPNDTQLGEAGAQVLIITGPNMAGKSTYLRQVGLLTLMAQIGSFVPADEACVPITDRIFTRVGAADRIASGQSTFLVEMNETAVILHHATERSLVLLDEIGRGTSTYDGLAIAWAVTEYLHGRQPRPPRTLFATHYHELTRLADDLPGVANLNVAVDESGGKITFLHRIVPGAADRSYGIHVAELAGVPDPVLRRARAILERLEMGQGVGGGDVQLGLFGWPTATPRAAGASRSRPPAAGARSGVASGALVRSVPDAPPAPDTAGAPRAPVHPAGDDPRGVAEREILEALEELAIDALRPIEALTLLDRWRQRLRDSADR